MVGAFAQREEGHVLIGISRKGERGGGLKFCDESGLERINNLKHSIFTIQKIMRTNIQITSHGKFPRIFLRKIR